MLFKNKKLGQVGMWARSRDLFLNFGISSISLEWIKLETSNLVRGLSARPTNNAKVDQKGRGLRHVTYFYNFGTPTTAIEQLNLQTSNLVHRLTTRDTIQKLQKLGQVCV